MIRNEAEYQSAVARLQEYEAGLKELHASLKQEGLPADQIKRGTDPLRSFAEGLRDEIVYYEHLKQGNIPDLQGFGTIGHALIALRIAQDVSQSELAKRLEVDPSQVSRDERNEYHGITIERAERVLQALGGNVRIRVQTKSTDEPPADWKRSRAKVTA